MGEVSSCAVPVANRGFFPLQSLGGKKYRYVCVSDLGCSEPGPQAQPVCRNYKAREIMQQILHGLQGWASPWVHSTGLSQCCPFLPCMHSHSALELLQDGLETFPNPACAEGSPASPALAGVNGNVSSFTAPLYCTAIVAVR